MIRRFAIRIAGYTHEFGLYSSLAWFDHHRWQLLALGIGVLTLVVCVSLWREEVR